MIENPFREVARLAETRPENGAALTLAQDLLALLNRAESAGMEVMQGDDGSFIVEWHVAGSVECIVMRWDDELRHYTMTKAMGVVLRG